MKVCGHSAATAPALNDSSVDRVSVWTGIASRMATNAETAEPRGLEAMACRCPRQGHEPHLQGETRTVS